jgi:hypothetical protein
MIYAYTMRAGQCYFGIYAKDDKAPTGYKLVRRAQYRSRAVADGHFERMIVAMASSFQTWNVVLVMGDSNGHILPYSTEQAARDSIATAWGLGAVKRCYLFGPDGTVKEVAK